MAMVDLVAPSSSNGSQLQEQEDEQVLAVAADELLTTKQLETTGDGDPDDDVEEDDGMTTRMTMTMKGVRYLSDSGITRLPDRYVLPAADRPDAVVVLAAGALSSSRLPATTTTSSSRLIKLPIVDLAGLRDPSRRAAVLATLDAACRDYGFFQVVNHGVGGDVTGGMLDVARRFFELPLAERARHMSADVRAAVRYGTSFNQARDAVLCWRDFLKLVCRPLREVAPRWPRQPADLRGAAAGYAAATHGVFMELMGAALEALGVPAAAGGLLGELAAESSSQMMTLNCYPACPQPELTLGMPPHSDYGLLTLVLQDRVEGLQVMHGDDGRWLTVEPVPGAFVVNVGDHLEIYSNGRYKSVVHRVRVNSTRPRISVASFHSLPAERVVGPAPELVDDKAGNPRRYMDTDFATFLAYLADADGKNKTFLQSRKLPQLPAAAPAGLELA